MKSTPVDRPTFDDQEAGELVEHLSALAGPNRLRVLFALAHSDGKCNVTELGDLADLDADAVRPVLAVLRGVGLAKVDHTRKCNLYGARAHFYRLTPKGVALHAALAPLLTGGGDS